MIIERIKVSECTYNSELLLQQLGYSCLCKIGVTTSTMVPTFPIALAAIVLVCLSPEVASQQCRSGVTDEVKQSVQEQLRQYQSGGNNRTFPTVAVNCGQVYTSIVVCLVDIKTIAVIVD